MAKANGGDTTNGRSGRAVFVDGPLDGVDVAWVDTELKRINMPVPHTFDCVWYRRVDGGTIAGVRTAIYKPEDPVVAETARQGRSDRAADRRGGRVLPDSAPRAS